MIVLRDLRRRIVAPLLHRPAQLIDAPDLSEEIENRIKADLNDFFRMKYATEPFDPKSPFHRSEYYKNLEELLREERAIPAA